MTFLVTYYAHPEMLRACIKSIRKFYPTERIIISQQVEDDPIPEDITGYELIRHDMRQRTWAYACMGLMEKCGNGIGVFIEHDCIFLKPIDDLLEKIGEYDLIGVEEMVGEMRRSKGFANQNFFILDVGEFIRKHGIMAVEVDQRNVPDDLKNVESGYGITQHSNNILFLPVTNSGYAHGTYYGDYVHHMWYGSYRKRGVESDGVSKGWMEEEVNRFLKDHD